MRAASGFAKDLAADIRGATSIEYAVIAAGICLVIIAGVDAVGAGVLGLFNQIAALF